MVLLYQELKPFLFALLFLGAMGAFTRSVWRLARLARLGRDRPHMFDDPVDRFGQVIYLAFFQKRVLGDRFGWNHAIFFWGFLIITVGHIEFFLRGMFPWFSLHFLGDTVYGAIVMGGDIMAALVLVSVGLALFRRVVIRPKHIDALSTDAFRILGMIANVMITYFLAMSFGLRGGHVDVLGMGAHAPISSWLAGVLWSGVPIDNAAGIWYEMFFWAHFFVLVAFLNYIPHSKHLHILGSIPNIYFYEKTKHKAALTRLDFENSEKWGVGKVTDFTWKGLLDTYACTECGRCDLYCPANRTKKPLKPQYVIHDMKDNLYANGDAILKQRGIFDFIRAPDDFEPKLPLIAESEETRQIGQTSPEVLWACTSCGACVEACPVLIDHVDSIMDMRRHLTLMEGNVAPELANTFKNIENNYNPWGIGADKRADWAKGLGLKYWGGTEDASKFEYLFWVGCAGSYDNRAQKTVKALTKIMDRAGIAYGILGTAEKCTGDPARRTGNEYLFDSLAQENVATLNDFGVEKIVTACPHCFNTLLNEYPAFGGNYEVLHHTQLIDELITAGRITLSQEIMKKVTFHDPCFLGRWNDETEAPRRSLAAVRHLNLIEMEEHGKKSFCCGAGGGQMWKEEEPDKRVNLERTRQALAVEPEIIGVGCPFCMTMLEDGVKHYSAEENVKVLDVAEIVAMAMEPKPVTAEPVTLPSLV